MGNSKGGGGAAKSSIGKPKGAIGKVFRQTVTGVGGAAGKMTAVKAGRNKKGK